MLIIRITSESEKKFFDILSSNSHIPLRDICRKIARVQVYRILQRLDSLQKNMSLDIFEKTYNTSSITSLPVVNIEVKKMVEVKEIEGEKWALIG